MVSSRTPKMAKVSYAERVMGAFNQLQREHKKHAIHPAALRAQVKKNAQVKKDKLGPNWSHWVGRALSKMEEEGIFEPATPKGSIALTSKGRKAVTYARRSVRKSFGGPPGQNEDGLVWKEVTSYSASSKRTRGRRSSMHNQYTSDDSDDYHTPTKASAKKRPRFSAQLSAKKPIYKMTKAELIAELDNLKKGQPSPNFDSRGSSPLTDLDSDDEGVTTHIREELREHDDETGNMRLLVDHNGGFTTPQAYTHTSRNDPFSPTQNNSPLPSRKHLGDIVRTESGTIIPDFSRQPTPSPSSPNTDMAYDERPLVSDDALPIQIQAVSNASLVSVVSDRITELERTVVERDMTIDALRKDTAAYKTELAALQDSWRRAEEMVTTNADRLATSEVLVGELRAKIESEAHALNTLENANDALVRCQDALKADLEQANAEYSAINVAKESLQSEKSIIENELATLREESHQLSLKIRELEEVLSKASADAQVLQKRNIELQLSRAQYRAEVEEAQRNCQHIEARICDKELAHEQTLSRLSATEKSATESAAQLTIAHASIASLTDNLTHLRKEEESLKISLTEATEDLKFKEAKSRELEAQLSDKDQQLHVSQQQVAEARLTIQSLHAEITGKASTIVRLANERDGVQERLSEAEACITDLRNAQEAERMDASRRISNVEASLSSAKADVSAKEVQMALVQQEKERLQSDLDKSTLLVEDLRNQLDIDRNDKSAMQANLLTSAAKIQDLETELRNLQNCKENDARSILTLKEYFDSFRESQAKLFGETGAKIDTILPSFLPQKAL